MVKTGEVYSVTWGPQIIDEKGYLQGHSARPRAIMNPCRTGFGPLQALQQNFFPLLKEHFPGFIHSMTGSEIIELVKSKIHHTWKAISIDGSAFDSSQFAELMKAVDNLFWKLMRPFVRDII